MAEVFFNGSAGRIEGRYHHNPQEDSPVALVLHPHPLYGGTMNNKVVYNIYQCFVRQGFSVLRFNFRGVGKSVGSYDDGSGELADATAALDWLQSHNPSANNFWVGGFSFGAWIGMQLLMRRPEINNFVSASPPVNMFDFSFLNPCPTGGLITQGDSDNVVSEADVSEFVRNMDKLRHVKIDYRIFADADHYYKNSIADLNNNIEDYIIANTGIGNVDIPLNNSFKDAPIKAFA